MAIFSSPVSVRVRSFKKILTKILILISFIFSHKDAQCRRYRLPWCFPQFDLARTLPPEKPRTVRWRAFMPNQACAWSNSRASTERYCQFMHQFSKKYFSTVRDEMCMVSALVPASCALTQRVKEEQWPMSWHQTFDWHLTCTYISKKNKERSDFPTDLDARMLEEMLQYQPK